MRNCKLLVQAAIAIFLLASPAQAGHFCDHCGCRRDCKKICRLECGKKKETTTEYECESEDFCIPGPSKKCGVKVECDRHGHHHRSIVWQPVCAKVHTRKKLVKKEVEKEVPDYKWVVEEFCCVCGHCIKIDDKREPSAKGEGKSNAGKSNAGESKTDKSKSGKSSGDKSESNKSKSERLPRAAEELPDPLAKRQDFGAYRAYYVGAEASQAALAGPPILIEGDSVASPPVEPNRQPRRLWRGLFDR